MLRKQAIIATTAAALLFGAAAGASAAPVLESIQAHLNWSTKFVVNGQAWTPESNGEKLAPIVYNNTTYLPIRTVSQALNVAVAWDAETQTVYLGERTDEVDITSVKHRTGAFAFATKDKQYTVQNGTDYGSGFVLEDLNSADKEFKLQPSGQYQKLHLNIFNLTPDYAIDVKIMDDNGIVLAHEKVDQTTQAVELDLDIGGNQEIIVNGESGASSKGKIFVTGYYK